MNHHTKELIRRSTTTNRHTNILGSADKNWHDKYPTTWFTNTYQAQSPSQWADQIMGATHLKWSSRLIQKAVKRIHKKMFSMEEKNFSCSGMNLRLAPNHMTRDVADNAH